jgi:hypothetical protein
MGAHDYVAGLVGIVGWIRILGDADADSGSIYGLPEGCSIVAGKNTGDEYTSAWTGTDDHIMAYDYRVEEDLTFNAIQFHTGNRSMDSRASVWLDDGGEPGSELVGGDFLTAMAHGWQGALLSEESTLSEDDHIWISWVANSGLTSRGSTGEYVFYKWAVVGSPVWNGPYSGRDKFRLLQCGAS